MNLASEIGMGKKSFLPQMNCPVHVLLPLKMSESFRMAVINLGRVKISFSLFLFAAEPENNNFRKTKQI